MHIINLLGEALGGGSKDGGRGTTGNPKTDRVPAGQLFAQMGVSVNGPHPSTPPGKQTPGSAQDATT